MEERGNLMGTRPRHSRSNSSKGKHPSNSNKSGNKQKRGKKGSNSSRNSSRKVLGFESVESDNKSPDLKKMSSNYLKRSKLSKNFNKDKNYSKGSLNLKSSLSSRNSNSRQSSEWKQQINSITSSKPPLPHTPNPLKRLSD